MNAVIYCRVSSKEQVEGTSLESQELSCRDYAMRNRLEVVRVFVDRGESAKFADRPQLLEMLAFCRKREHAVDQLLVWKVDRLARNVGDHFNIKAALMKNNVRVVSATEPIDAKPEGRLLETILAGFAQFDNDVRAARTVQGMRRKLQEGIFPWQPPLGYKGAAVPGSKKAEPDVPDQPAFGILQQAWTKFATGGFTKAEILRFLNECRMRSRSGKPLTSQFVDHFFEDRYYAGILCDPWSGEEILGRHLPMVSREAFETVQNVIASRNRSLPHIAVRPEFPLRTFVRCANCEHTLTGSFSRGRSRYYGYYHCNNRACDIRGYHPLDEIHGEFRQFLDESSASAHAIEHLKQYLGEINGLAASQVEVMRHRRETEQKRAQEQMKELIRLKVDGLITEDEFREQRNIIGKQIEPADGLAEVASERDLETVLANVDAVSVYLRNLGDAWSRVEPPNQRRFHQILIPHGYAAGRVGTARKGHLLSFFSPSLPADTHWVPHAGDSWNHLIADLRGLTEVFRESH